MGLVRFGSSRVAVGPKKTAVRLEFAGAVPPTQFAPVLHVVFEAPVHV